MPDRLGIEWFHEVSIQQRDGDENDQRQTT
jgi:hypothetical protein